MIESGFPLNRFLTTKSNSSISAPPIITDNSENKDGTNVNSESTELKLLNDEMLSILKTSLGQEKFESYIGYNLNLTRITNDTAYFLVSTAFIKKVIEHQYIENLKQAILKCLGKNLKIQILLKQEVETNTLTNDLKEKNKHPSLVGLGDDLSLDEYQVNKGKTVKETSFVLSDIQASANLHKKEIIAEIHNLDSKKHFDAFIVGPSNNLAHASSIAVAKNPGQLYQSLYIHGNSGLGKTHLLHAIANYIYENNPTQRIIITTATEFMSEMIHAIQEKAVPLFRKKYYESIDVLLIDDIHELKNREGTQNEFFHIFNELQRRKKQLVFTSDKDPKEITGIEDRIKTRLSSALVVEIQQPDLETRIAILKKKAIDKDIYLPDDVVTLIASCIKNNIRELEGSLIKLGAYSSIFKVDIDLQTAKEQLRINDSDQEKTINIESIARCVSQHYKIPVPDLKSKTRAKDITIARHIAMYMAYYMAKATLAEIGNFFGKRDHTSVIHAVNKIKAMHKSDPVLSKTLYEIECML